MIEILKNWIVNIVALIMMLVLIEIMIPSDKFKKYISLVTGLLLMIVIINPIASFISKGTSLDNITLKAFNTFDQNELERNQKNFNDFQNSQILAVYKEKLIDQIKNKILSIDGIKDATVDIKIEEDINNKSFGTIYGIDADVHASKITNNQSGNIEKVSVNLEKPKEEKNTELVKAIKDSLTQVYELPAEKINITVH